ncbi:hypothetical protein MMC13_000770 [Lambiella insularis]|nr:hypothetical protein [Lambiella insularis]
MGTVCAATTQVVTLHMTFPHLPINPDRDFTAMTQEQIERWNSQVWWRALFKVMPAHISQHLPNGYAHAVANTHARREVRLVDSASYQAQMTITYHIQQVYLQDIWDEVLRLIEEVPGLADFREPQLFFCAKGTKLQFKANHRRPTLLNTIDHFLTSFEEIFDLHHVDLSRTFHDLGMEISPTVAHLHDAQLHVDEELLTYLWKRCCLQSIIRRIYDNRPGARGGPTQRYYNTSMLYDAASVTSEPPKDSKLYRGGVRKVMLYPIQEEGVIPGRNHAKSAEASQSSRTLSKNSLGITARNHFPGKV